VRALSEAQHQAATAGGLPEPERIADDLWSVAVPMPGDFLAYSLSAVHIGPAGALTVLDPGWGSDAALEHLEAFLGAIGRTVADVRTVVVTHSHPDHIGLAPRLRDLTGATIVLSGREQRSVDAAVVPAADATRARLEAWGVAPGRSPR
jgi:glyoxylase-like metal-dependent hydrolase (beta-lactamase superfamily II)